MAIVPTEDVFAFLRHGRQTGVFRVVGPGQGDETYPSAKPTIIAAALFAMSGRSSSESAYVRGGSRPHLEVASALVARINALSGHSDDYASLPVTVRPEEQGPYYNSYPQPPVSSNPRHLGADVLYTLRGRAKNPDMSWLMEPMNSRQLDFRR